MNWVVAVAVAALEPVEGAAAVAAQAAKAVEGALAVSPSQFFRIPRLR